MNQIIDFDQSKGGHIPNFCLANVVSGYGIKNKYGSAWEAWQHTQQHREAYPSNLDIPLFYSYTTTIDGVTENYGHINVRLKNGTVWSDGNIYANLDAYLQNHSPKYVGWGESVNDYKIIGGEEMFNEGDRVNFNGVLYGSDKGYHKEFIGKDWKSAMYGIVESAEYRLEHYFNEGDRTNFLAAFYGSDNGTLKGAVGKVWKPASYDIITELEKPNQSYKPYTQPQLYTKA